MPTYEYQCGTCGYQMEAFQKMSDEPLRECPKCNQPTLNKLISAAQFQLKGSGWYMTDYRKKSDGESQSGSGDKGSETTSKDTTPKDSSNNSAAG